MVSKVLLCNCAKTQAIDAEGIEAATGLVCSRVHSGLCTHELARAAEAMADGGTMIACEQEAAVFEDLAEELDIDPPLFVDIRDRAGWSRDAAQAMPKMAALLALARLGRPPEKTMDVVSEGVCLILGAPDIGIPVAEQLSDTLAVTCLLDTPAEIIPDPRRRIDVHVGKLRNATGALGGFRVSVDGFRQVIPSGRGIPEFSAPRDGAASECDIILELRGGTPLFPAPEKREGYLRADPGDPIAVQRAASDAAQMVGTFEKPLYVRMEESLCAHSRAEKTGCTRCLDLCPTGAISPAGDHVVVDPDICAGCGACSAVCPSGAISYDDPPVAHVFAQIRTLAEVYRKAGGKAPRLLVHDADHGRQMISLAARFGQGLPADVLPLQVSALSGFGHAEMLAALATGFSEVTVLAGPRTERDALDPQLDLSLAIAGGGEIPAPRLRIVDPVDPDELSDLLYGDRPEPSRATPVLPIGGRRDVTRLAAKALAGGTEVIALPQGAPYGAVLVDTDACTLCLACASLCPSGALADHPDKPQLNFREDACLQCGICATICPETAITLEPRLNLTDAALSEQVLNEEEPYECIECGTPFGVKSTIERIVAKLEGQHSMFTNSDNARLIRMCDDCRVKAQYHDQAAPFRMGDRPRVRTTDDYLTPKDKT